MIDQIDMSCLNMTLHDIKQTQCANINPNDPCTSCDYIIINNDIFDSKCVGNDFNLTKHIKIKALLRIYTHLYTVI
jgi:hypothetical protein